MRSSFSNEECLDSMEKTASVIALSKNGVVV